MSLHTLGGVDITDLTRDELDDSSIPHSFSDALLNRWLASAVRRYSLAQPYLQETSISHVQDQDIYALPSNFLWMVECQYRLDFDVDVYEPMEETTLAGYTTYDWPSLDLIRRNLRVRYDNIGRGGWEVITQRTSYTTGKYLVVYPAPNDSINSFTIRYACLHPLVSSDYYTIPSEHVDYFVKLLMARGLRRRATETDKSPLDYDAGQTRVRRGGQAGALRREARILEAEVWNALRSPVIAIG